MNECSGNITIQRQVNESWERNNYLTVIIQGDAYHLVADIQVWLITHDEKEKMQPCNLNSPHILDWSYQFYIGKKLLILKTDHLLAKTEQVHVDNLTASTIYHHKMPYHAVLLNSRAESNQNTKRNVQKVTRIQKEVIIIVKKTLWIYGLPVFFTLRN